MSEYFFMLWETWVALSPSLFLSISPPSHPALLQYGLLSVCIYMCVCVCACVWGGEPWCGFHSWLDSSNHRFLCGLPLSPLFLLHSFPPFSHPSLFLLQRLVFLRKILRGARRETHQRTFAVKDISKRFHPHSQFVLPVHLSFQPMRKEPEVVTVTLKKHNGMGLSIVAAKVGNVTWMEVWVCEELNPICCRSQISLSFSRTFFFF